MDYIPDEKDLALIRELKKDSRLSEQKLAGKTGIPMTTVHNRLRKLRGLGVIKGYTIKVDHAMLGRPLTAFVQIKAAPGADRRGLLCHIASMEEVDEASLISSEWEIILKARVPSLNYLDSVFVEGLRRIAAVSEARALISFESIERP